MRHVSPTAAVFVPDETQNQGEVTNFVKVRRSIGCIQKYHPFIEQKEGSSVKEAFPASHLVSFCTARTRKDGKVCVLGICTASSVHHLSVHLALLQHMVVEGPGITLPGFTGWLPHCYLVTLDKLPKALPLLWPSEDNDGDNLRRCFLEI